MIPEVLDISDLRIEIEVRFIMLQWYEPAVEWSWYNPALIAWMRTYGFSHHNELPPAALWYISFALGQRIDRFKRLAELPAVSSP